VPSGHFPFIKWAGGKSQLLNVLVKCIPQTFGTYFEPFLGGGALFFKLYSMRKIRRAVLSDANMDLMNCYIAIRDDVEALLTELELLQQHAGEKDFFYQVARPKFNKIQLKTGLEGEVAKAALMLYLNKTCYNGLYRVNSEGEFNVPWGRYENPHIYDEENIRKTCKILRNGRITLKCCDYKRIIVYAREKDFVYLDPPYQPISATSWFTQYTSDSFTAEDQRKLAGTFRDLDATGCYVLMSNSYNILIDELYKEYIDRGNAIKTLAARQISCKGSRRRHIYEYIIFNYSRNQ
jgi:DNA adenine methylase